LIRTSSQLARAISTAEKDLEAAQKAARLSGQEERRATEALEKAKSSLESYVWLFQLLAE
jgi:hypothetical protein